MELALRCKAATVTARSKDIACRLAEVRGEKLPMDRCEAKVR